MAKKLLQSELDKDYRLKGYFKHDRDTFLINPSESAFDVKGDLVKVRYYKNYDETMDTFSDLAVSEDRTYIRGTDGLLKKRIINHKWWLNGEVVGEKTTVKHYDKIKAYKLQKRASKNLVDRASIYLFQKLIIDNNGDNLTGMTKSRDFLREIATEKDNYIEQDKQPLIDKIQNTTNSDIAQEIKNTLTTILNISYID